MSVRLQRSVHYRTLVNDVMVGALKSVFATYADPQFAGINISPQYPLTQIDYPSIVFEFEDTGLYNMGVGHEEWFDDVNGQLRKWHHRRFEGTASFHIYTLSPLDRDVLADSLIEILSFGRLSDALLPFFTTIYGDPSANFDWQSMLSQLALNIDEIEGEGNNATLAPWSPEDVLVHSTSYSCRLHGGIYNIVPGPNYPKVTEVNATSYPQFNVQVDGVFSTVPPVDPSPGAIWTNPFIYADVQAIVKGVGQASGLEQKLP